MPEMTNCLRHYLNTEYYIIIIIITLYAQAFVRAFFEQNPLSNLGIVRLRDGRAEQISELSGSPVRRLGDASKRVSRRSDAH